jgi:hypothetical protein
MVRKRPKLGFWALRDQLKPFNPKKTDDIIHAHLPGHEGELWAAKEKTNALWLLLVANAGHNDLSVISSSHI